MELLLAHGYSSAELALLLLFLILVGTWLLGAVLGLVTWLLALWQPFGWRWGLRRFLAGMIAVNAAVVLGFLGMYEEIDRGEKWMGFGSLVLAALLVVPTLARRASEGDGAADE